MPREMITASAPFSCYQPGQRLAGNSEPTQADFQRLAATVDRYERKLAAEQQAISQAIQSQVAPLVRRAQELRGQQEMAERHRQGLTVHRQQPATDFTLPEELCE